MGRIVESIILPEVWMDRILDKIQLADEADRVPDEREQTE